MRSAERRQCESELRWVSVVGARPQFVKLAPVCRAIEAHNNRPGSTQIDHCIVHTGQHYDREVADLLFAQLEIPSPKYNLGVESGSQGTQLARMLARLERVLTAERPDWVIVYGDTNSTLAGALLASRHKLPLAHVEAGCRTADIGMPEEQNRILSDHLSQLLLVPSQRAIQNLKREGIGSEGDERTRRNVMVGDVMYDALLQHRKFADESAGDYLREFNLKSREYYLLTIHRAENTSNTERLRGILSAASKLDLPVFFPVHPRTKHVLASLGLTLNGNLQPAPPIGYLEMLAIESHARKILTDSGGVQREAFYLGVPCVTLRDRTEWPETLELGANRFGGTTWDSIHEAVNASYCQEWLSFCPYGDGNAAGRIVNELLGEKYQ